MLDSFLYRSHFWLRSGDHKGGREEQRSTKAAIAQLGEHQTEDLKVPGSIPGGGKEDKGERIQSIHT